MYGPQASALPTNSTALWTARYCVTTSQRTRQLADHNPDYQPGGLFAPSVVWARTVDFMDKPISRLAALCLGTNLYGWFQDIRLL
ncbi:MAG: hypothetical protein ACYDCW_10545, partial [Acidithiobacillus ferrivorans]